jgi:hypothetical protein
VGSFGFTGSFGYTGSQGPAGTFGGAAFEYYFNGNTADPTAGANGEIRLSNTTFSNANTLYISYVDQATANVQPFLQTIDDSTSAIKGHFTITEIANNDNYVMYAIIGNHVQDSQYFNVPISYLSGSAAAFANNTNVVVTFARTGDIGDVGYTGSRGDLGYVGSIGYTGSRGLTGQANVGNVVPTSSDSGSFWLDTDTGILSLNVGDYGNTVWISVSY